MSATEKQITENTNHNPLERARQLSRVISAAEMEYVEGDTKLDEIRGRVDNLTMGVSLNVARLLDEKQKPVFSNDLARKAEVQDRLAVHPHYQELCRALHVAETEQEHRRIEIDQMLRDFQLARLAYEAIAIGRRQ